MTLPERIKLIDELVREDDNYTILDYRELVSDIDNITKSNPYMKCSTPAKGKSINTPHVYDLKVGSRNDMVKITNGVDIKVVLKSKMSNYKGYHKV